jgi:hypothetical protein
MLGARFVKTTVVTLSSTKWSNGAQTVNCEGVSSDTAKCHVFTTYQPGSYEQYRDSYVQNSAQGDGTLTFTYDYRVKPTADININVAIYYDMEG